MNRKSYSTEIAENSTNNLEEKSKVKVWVWSAVALIITNLVVVGIVAFLIHRDSVQINPQQSQNEQRRP